MTAETNCAVCGKPVERVRPCGYYARFQQATCDDCCDECYHSEPFPCEDHDRRLKERQEEREKYIQFMQENGFIRREAEKMADYALQDFDSYKEAKDYYSENTKFLFGQVYAGHRKARRLFRRREG